MRSPIRWFGGKGQMAAKILPYLHRWEHVTYVEPFGGGASMLFAKRPSPVEVYNDLDHGLYHFFRTLADPRDFAQFYRRVQPLLYSRELYGECWSTWDVEEDPIWKAVKWFVVARMSFSGSFGAGWGSAITEFIGKVAETASKWLSIIDLLPEIHDRIKRVQIENQDWRTILDRYDTTETLFYLDPPYIPETRSSGKYAHEMTLEDHRDLEVALHSIRGAAVLSGYPHAVYNPLRLEGWGYEEFETACHAAGKTKATGIQGEGSATEKQPRTECLWIHPTIMNTNRQRTIFD